MLDMILRSQADVMRLREASATIEKLEKEGYLLEMGRHDPTGYCEPGWYAIFMPPNPPECDECGQVHLNDFNDYAHDTELVTAIEKAAEAAEGAK